MSLTKVLLLNRPSFSERKYCQEIMGGFGLEVGDSLRYPPLPLAYTAAILERASVPVDILDADALELDEAQILSRVQAGGFDLVGVISSLITMGSDLAFVLDLEWWAETSLNLIDEELLVRMRAAGMTALSLGVESGGAEQQREHWDKKILSLEQTREIFQTCHRLGLATRAYFVMGFPGETAASRVETIRWARALRPTTLQFLPYRELPATPEEYSYVEPELLREIKRAYLAYYLTPANLVRQLMQPKLFLNRIKRFASLRRS